MINVIDIIGKHLEAQGIGVYDEYALGGNIFAGKMCGKDNNQIVLLYRTTTSFLSGNNTIGNLTVRVYNRNYPQAVELLGRIESALANSIVAGSNGQVQIAPLTTIEDVDVSNQTELLCVQSEYTTQII